MAAPIQASDPTITIESLQRDVEKHVADYHDLNNVISEITLETFATTCDLLVNNQTHLQERSPTTALKLAETQTLSLITFMNGAENRSRFSLIIENFSQTVEKTRRIVSQHLMQTRVTPEGLLQNDEATVFEDLLTQTDSLPKLLKKQNSRFRYFLVLLRESLLQSLRAEFVTIRRPS